MASGRSCRCRRSRGDDRARTGRIPTDPTHRRRDGARERAAAHPSTPLDRITPNQVLRWFDAYSQTAPGGANHALKLLRQILNFAIACGYIGTNPARGVKRNRSQALTRFLSRDEIRRLHEALDARSRTRPGARQQADIIRLLLLTGCRKREILRLRWSEVAGDALAPPGFLETPARAVPTIAAARGRSPFRHGLNRPPAPTRSPARSLTQLDAWI